MKENTLILPKVFNIPSNSSSEFNSDLNSSRYLINKKCNTKYDLPQFNDLSLNNPQPLNATGNCFTSNYNPGNHCSDLSNNLVKERESLKRDYNLAFENTIDVSNKRRNNTNIGTSLSNNNANCIGSMSNHINPGVNHGIGSVGYNINNANGFNTNDDRVEKAMIDRITSISTTNVKKIMDLLSRSNSIKEFQSQLQSLILNLCVDLYKNNDEVIDDLQKRVDYLTDEKLLLSNLIKSQYHSIKKLKEDEYNVNKSEEENMMLKSELSKFKHIVNNLVYSSDKHNKGADMTEYINRFAQSLNKTYRKPPDVC